jgi:hypothetical protein
MDFYAMTMKHLEKKKKREEEYRNRWRKTLWKLFTDECCDAVLDGEYHRTIMAGQFPDELCERIQPWVMPVVAEWCRKQKCSIRGKIVGNGEGLLLDWSL